MKKQKTQDFDSAGQESYGIPEGKCSIEERAMERGTLDLKSPLTSSVD